MKVFAVFSLADPVFEHNAPDELMSLWSSRELAQAEVDRLIKEEGWRYKVEEMDVHDK